MDARSIILIEDPCNAEAIVAVQTDTFREKCELDAALSDWREMDRTPINDKPENQCDTLANFLDSRAFRLCSAERWKL